MQVTSATEISSFLAKIPPGREMYKVNLTQQINTFHFPLEPREPSEARPFAESLCSRLLELTLFKITFMSSSQRLETYGEKMTSPPGILTSPFSAEERASGVLAWPAGVLRASLPRGAGETWRSVWQAGGRLMGARVSWGAGAACGSQHPPPPRPPLMLLR